MLENATLSLDVDHKKLGTDPKITGAKKRSYDDIVEPVVKQKFAKIRDHYNELTLTAEGGYAVLPGSLHPSGRVYEATAGDWTDIPKVSRPKPRRRWLGRMP